jgi:effector-binding domain-containing protein
MAMITMPEIKYRTAQPYAAVRLQAPIPFGKLLQPAWEKVQSWLAGQGIANGPAIIRYLTTDMSSKLDIEVGFFIAQAIPGSGDIVTGVLPAGQFATLRYTGPYKGKGIYKANVAVIEWAKANKVAWKTTQIDGVDWWDARLEIYLSDPAKEKDPKKYVTELAFQVSTGVEL